MYILEVKTLHRLGEWNRKRRIFRWCDPFTYFSVWNLLFGFISVIYPQSEMICSMTRCSMILSSVGGAYVAYIYPRYVRIWYLEMMIKGIIFYMIDILFHHLPCIYFLWRDWDRQIDLWMGMIPIVIYMYIQDKRIYELYSISYWDLKKIGEIFMIMLS